ALSTADASSPLPYPTLFRSPRVDRGRLRDEPHDAVPGRELEEVAEVRADVAERAARAAERGVDAPVVVGVAQEPVLQVGPVHERSEEHTSELQSRENLVCRL